MEVNYASSWCGVSKGFSFLILIHIFYSHNYSYKLCCYIIQLHVLKAVFARSVMTIFISVVFP